MEKNYLFQRKEIKTRLNEIQNTLSNNTAKTDIASLTFELDHINAAMADLMANEKTRVDKAKAEFDATPFTAFGRRKELKQTYQTLNEQYLAKKTAYENQIKTLTTEINKIKKTMK